MQPVVLLFCLLQNENNNTEILFKGLGDLRLCKQGWLEFIVTNFTRCSVLGSHFCSRRHQLLHAKNEMKARAWSLGSLANLYAFDKDGQSLVMISFFARNQREGREQPPRRWQGCCGLPGDSLQSEGR